MLAAVATAVLALPHQAAAQDRTLAFKQLHTGETLSVTYMRNGRYDPEGLRRINHIFRDWRRNEAIDIDPRLLDILWEVREATGSRAPVHVVSAYRSPVTNAALRARSSGVADNSLHTRGRALDFNLPDVPLSRMREVALKFQAGGVGFYPGSSFIHIDTGSVRHWPRLSRQQLANLFPDGRTLHLPADGKPLAGYELAKADAARGTLSRVRTGTAAGASGGGTGLLAALFGGGRGAGQATPQRQADPSAPIPSSPATASAPTQPAATAPRVTPIPPAPEEAPRTQVATLSAPLPAPRPNREQTTPEIETVAEAETPLVGLASLTTAALPRQRPATASAATGGAAGGLSAGAIEALMALAPSSDLDRQLPFSDTFPPAQKPRRASQGMVSIDLDSAELRPSTVAQSSLHGPALAQLRHPTPQAVAELPRSYAADATMRFAVRDPEEGLERFASSAREPAAEAEEQQDFIQTAAGFFARLFR